MNVEEHSLLGTIGTLTLSFVVLVDEFSVRPQPATYNLSPTEAVSGGVGKQMGLMYSAKLFIVIVISFCGLT